MGRQSIIVGAFKGIRVGGQRRAPIRVGVIDDHPVYRLGLKRAFERQPDIEISWDLSSAANLESTIRKTPVDVLLMDIYLGPGKDGIAATREVLERWPDIKVAAMSASLDARVGASSLRAGARVFVPKSAPVDEMVSSIRKLAEEGRNARKTAKAGAGPARPRMRIAGLSPRQRQVLGHLRLGRTNREIASRLGVSVATVNKHVHEVLAVLNVRNRTEAAAAATVALGGSD